MIATTIDEFIINLIKDNISLTDTEIIKTRLSHSKYSTFELYTSIPGSNSENKVPYIVEYIKNNFNTKLNEKIENQAELNFSKDLTIDNIERILKNKFDRDDLDDILQTLKDNLK